MAERTAARRAGGRACSRMRACSGSIPASDSATPPTSIRESISSCQPTGTRPSTARRSAAPMEATSRRTWSGSATRCSASAAAAVSPRRRLRSTAVVGDDPAGLKRCGTSAGSIQRIVAARSSDGILRSAAARPLGGSTVTEAARSAASRSASVRGGSGTSPSSCSHISASPACPRDHDRGESHSSPLAPCDGDPRRPALADRPPGAPPLTPMRALLRTWSHPPLSLLTLRGEMRRGDAGPLPGCCRCFAPTPASPAPPDRFENMVARGVPACPVAFGS